MQNYKKILLAILIFALLAFFKPFGVKDEPNLNRREWYSFSSNVDNFLINYKIPSYKNEDYGKNELLSHVESIEFDPKKVIQNFIGARYDTGYAFAQFKITIGISKYFAHYDRKPDINTFRESWLEQLNNYNVLYDLDIKKIGAEKTLHVINYNEENLIRAESYRLPFTNEYYLDVSAFYEQEMVRKSPQWLEERKNIVKDIFHFIEIKNAIDDSKNL